MLTASTLVRLALISGLAEPSEQETKGQEDLRRSLSEV